MKASGPQDSSADNLALVEVERVAAEWILRQALGLTAEEDNELARWLAADKERARIFAEMEQTSHLLDGLNFQSAGSPAAMVPTHSRKPSWRSIAGVAASVLLGAGVWEITHYVSSNDRVVAESAPGGESARGGETGQKERLEFSDTPLAEVVAKFNRYNRHKIVIADAELAARRFGGGFATHQIEPFLELLEQSYGVVAEHRANETVIRLVK